MLTSRRTLPLGTMIPWVLFASGCAHVQTAGEPPTATLLAYSEVDDVLGGVRSRVDAQLASLGVTPTPPQTEILDRFLALRTLRPMMEQEFEAMGDSDLRTAAARLVVSGAIARADSLQRAHPSTGRLTDFVKRLESSPPPQARVQLMTQMVAAQSAGPFYMLLSESIREAGHRIARGTDPSLERFAPLTQGEWVAGAEQAHSQAVVAFLHRYENVPDDVLEATLREWISDPGAWFVEAYSVAVGQTVLAAADSIVASITSGQRRRVGFDGRPREDT